MIFYYLHELRNGKATNLIDYNLKTDYGRLRRLVNCGNNKERMRELIENQSVNGNVVKQFSIETVNENDHFLSLLFYMGLLTIDNSNLLLPKLKIPNYSVKTMFWEYFEKI